jgi:hypothetical protein
MNQTIGPKKILSRVIWRIDGFNVVDMMPAEEYFNTESFLTPIMDHLLAKLRLSVHLDDCRVHSSNALKWF